MVSESILNWLSPISVSYTHLDVYKRQVYWKRKVVVQDIVKSYLQNKITYKNVVVTKTDWKFAVNCRLYVCNLKENFIFLLQIL